MRAHPRSAAPRLSSRPVPAPKTASRGLRPLPHRRLSRWRVQATDASGKNRPGYDPVRRGAVLPQSGQQDNCSSSGVSDIVKSSRAIQQALNRIASLQGQTGLEHGFVVALTSFGPIVSGISAGTSEAGWTAPKFPSVLSLLHSGAGLIFFHSHPSASAGYETGLSPRDVTNGDQAYTFGFSEGMSVATQDGRLFCSRAKF